MSFKTPDDLFYYKEHEWLKQNTDGSVTVGISDFAQNNLTDIVYAGLKVKVGDKINFGQSIGEVESVKSVNEIYTPISGEVVAINEKISDAPESINSDPYEAWFIKVKPSNLDAEKKQLMDAKKYSEYCTSL